MEQKNKAAQDMRAIPSEKRTAAVLRNLAVARASKPLKPCTCRAGTRDGVHKSACPVWVRENQRHVRERKQASERAD